MSAARASGLPHGYEKKPCSVCGTSQIMPRGQAVCDECRKEGLSIATFNGYAETASRTNQYPRGTEFYDLVMGLCSEAGEVAGLAKKIDRDAGGMWEDSDKRHLALEIGDVLWYCSQLAKHAGFSFARVAEMNVEKLSSRAKRGAITGSGDDR